MYTSLIIIQISLQSSFLIIFATNSLYYNVYNSLKNEIFESSVAELEKDGGNVVDIIGNELHIYLLIYWDFFRGKSLLESWVTTFLPDWQLPLIFVWFTSKSHEH